MKLAYIGTTLPPRDERDWVVSQELIDASGITYRQLDYWTRTGLLTANDPMPGSGYIRRYHESQVERATTIASLVWAGFDLPLCRRVIDELLDTGRVKVGPFTLTRGVA